MLMTFSRRLACAFVAVSLAATAYGRGNLKELAVPLKYIPQEGVHQTSADIPAALLKEAVEVRVEDARKLDDPLVIGQGTGGDDKLFPIHADHDVVAFIQEMVTGIGKDWSLKQEHPAARTLILQVTRFYVDESNKALGSIYGTEVKFAFTLKDARGKTLAEGTGSGTAHRYGHAHSPENINEVLSDALKEAYAKVLADPGLQKAWAFGNASGGPTARAAESAEERPRNLDDLLKSRLITKTEYDKRKNSKKTTVQAVDDPEARFRREWEMLRDPKTGTIPQDIGRLEQEFAASLPSVEAIRALPDVNLPDALTWISRGPNNIGGRTRALAYDVSDASHNTILAGGVSGGVWRTTNGGANWTQTTGTSQLHSITCLKQDTRNGKTSTWYAGTGELTGNSANAIGAFFLGNGIYKSTDGGMTWSFLSATSSGTPQSFDNSFDLVLNVAVDASNSSQDEVYAAAYGSIYRTVDGGTSWSRVLGSGNNGSYTDVAVTSTGVVYATVSSDGSTRGLYRSPDGVTWTNLTPAGFPATYGRIVIGIAPSNESIVYFFGYTSGSGTNGHSFWQYDGSAFVNRSLNLPSGINTQGGYDAVVTVKPNDANTVFVGGTNIYRSTDAFASSTHTTQIGGYSTIAAPGAFGMYTNHHPDIHVIVFEPGSSLVMLSGDDGGVQRTTDATASTVSWTPLNNGYRVSQFYTAAIDEGTSGNNVIIGGLQDQGWFHNGGAAGSANWTQVGGGDGTVMAIASGRSYYYGETQWGALSRINISDSGVVGSDVEIAPGGATGQQFVNPYVLDPNNSSVMYYLGGSTIWRNSDLPNATQSNGWTNLTSSTVSGASISAIAVSKSTANRLFYGTDDGRVYRIDGANSGSTPTRTDIWTGKGLPSGAYVLCIAIDPTDGNRALLVFSNYGVVSLFYTTNGGSTWSAVAGNLEQNADGSGNGPSCRWAVIVNGSFYVGTSTGLYSTAALNDASTVWAQEGSTTIGNVVIDHLVARPVDGLVVAVTHANGIFSGTTGGGPNGSCGNTGVSTIPAPSAAAANLPSGGVWTHKLRERGETWTYTFEVGQKAEGAKAPSGGDAKESGGTGITRSALWSAPASPHASGGYAIVQSGEAASPPLSGRPMQRRFAVGSDIARMKRFGQKGVAGVPAAGYGSIAASGSEVSVSRLNSPARLGGELALFDVEFHPAAPDKTVSSVRVFLDLDHPHVEQLRIWLASSNRELLLWDGVEGGTRTGSSLVVDRVLSEGLMQQRFADPWSLYISDSGLTGDGVLKQAWIASAMVPRATTVSGTVGALATLDVAASRAYLRTSPNAGTEVDPPTVGQAVYLHGDYQITGSGSSVTVNQRALLDGSLFCSFGGAGSPGFSYTGWCNSGWTATAGTHTLQWDYDYTNTISETNENNNSVFKTFSAAGLDITASRAYLRTAPNGGTEIDPPTVGQTVYLHGDYQITGSGSSVTVNQRALLDGSLFCSFGGAGSPGFSYTGWCSSGWTATAGTHTLQWDYDYTNTILETNENNNSVSKTFTAAGLDIAASRAYLRTAPNGGAEVDPPTVGQTVYLHGDYQITGSGGSVNVNQRALLDGSLFCSFSGAGSPGFSYTGWCTSGWTATAGTHTLQWDYDYTNTISETNENNNSVSKTFSGAGLDIAASRAYLRTAPNGGAEVDPPTVGQTVYLHGDYQITGSGSSVNVDQRALLDGSLFCSFSGAGSPGFSYTGWCNSGWTATSGTHTLQWDYDYTTTISETNENNNSVSKSFTPSGGAIDIVAQRAYLRTAASGGGSEVTQPTSGQAVYFHADYQVTGSGNAVNVTERALLDGNVLCACSNSATPGTSYVASCNQAWTATSGSHTLQWDFDYGNAVAETNENNNSASTSFTTSGGGDTTPPTGSVTINSGGAFTSSTNVTLGLSANDAVGVVGYYVSNSSTIPTAGQAGWTDVASTTSLVTTLNNWPIASGDGGKTVYAWYKDAAGNVSGTSSDGITLDQTAPSNGTLNTTPGDQQVQLAWSGQIDSTSGVASYKLVFATGSTPPANCGGSTLATASPFTHSGLTNQQPYSYRLCATDAAGNINGGATGTATPTPAPLSHIRNDFDGDGKADVVWRHTSGANAVWFMNGGALGFGAYTPSLDTNWTLAGTGDFNGDGKADLLWRHTSGLVSIWLMNGATVSSSANANSLDSSWTVAGVGDFDGDGKDDILWRHSSGTNAIWFMNGTAIASGTYTNYLDSSWSAAAVGDFNGDHMADILWRHTSGVNAVWLMNGATMTTGAYVNTLDATWTLVATGDYDGDGKADVFWRHTSGVNAIWFMNGAAIQQGAYTSQVASGWTPVATGDFNGDGKADLMWCFSDGTTAIWLMNGTGLSGTYGPILPTSWSARPNPATNGQ